MNFKIQQTYPSPSHGIAGYNSLVYANKINSIVLYGEQKPASQAPAQQPKKKIAFKVDKSVSAPTNDKISIFSIAQRKWQIVQAKGKIPTPRSDYKCIYMDPCMIIYGGKANNKLSNQVYALNCENWTWKKLFSIDGTPTSQQIIFFKITTITAGLIVNNSLWFLQVADVKWELSANQLPGSVWEKTNISLPQNVQFCWPITSQILLIVGKKKTIKVNIVSKQIQKEFQFDTQKYIKTALQKQDNKIINVFTDALQNENGENICYLSYIVFINSVYIMKYTIFPNDSIQMFSQQYSKIPIKRPIKCSSFISTPSLPSSSSNLSIQKQIYYIDTKGQLLSINLSIQIPQAQPNTVRIIQSPDKAQTIIRNNSCILQQQQNEDSSIFVASSNSRTKINQNNGRIQRLPRQQNSQLQDDQDNIQFDQHNDDNDVQRFGGSSEIINSQKIIKKKLVGDLEITTNKNNMSGSYNQAYNSQQYKATDKNQSNRIDGSRQSINQKNQSPAPQYMAKKINSPNNHMLHNNSFTNTNNPNHFHHIQPNQRFKYKTQQHNDNRNKSIESPQLSTYKEKKNQIYPTPRDNVNEEENNQQPQSQLKFKLQKILYNETVKRKLLETKIQALQNIIIKSERFVLELCKFGNAVQKKKHIQRVKKIREQIQNNLKKQLYYRKEMEGNKLPNQISQQVENTMSHIQY